MVCLVCRHAIAVGNGETEEMGAMTLGRVEEVLDEVQEGAASDYRPETMKYIVEVLNEVRTRLGLDARKDD